MIEIEIHDFGSTSWKRLHCNNQVNPILAVLLIYILALCGMHVLLYCVTLLIKRNTVVQNGNFNKIKIEIAFISMTLFKIVMTFVD